MGNLSSAEEKNTLKEILDMIKNIPLQTLDIGTRNGRTGYLDFIKPEELGSNNIMKGMDLHSRPFFVFKATFEYPDGKTKNTFTTLFQRYNDDAFLWHCCGHYGQNLMITEGGVKIEQFKLLYKLFSSGEYKIDKNLIYGQKLNFKNNDVEFDDFTDNDYPLIIKLSN